MNTDTRLIPLTQGKFAIVDAIDYEWLTRFKWSAMKQITTTGVLWYAVRHGPKPEVKVMLMHREIAAKQGLQSKRYDHADHNGLNNVRENIRPCTPSQNRANSRKMAGTTSRFKGVHWHTNSSRWRAAIYVLGKKFWLGNFRSETDAAFAYAVAARRYFGDFACTE